MWNKKGKELEEIRIFEIQTFERMICYESWYDNRE